MPTRTASTKACIDGVSDASLRSAVAAGWAKARSAVPNTLLPSSQTGRVVGRFGLPTLLDLLAGTNVHDVNKKVLTFTA